MWDPRAAGRVQRLPADSAFHDACPCSVCNVNCTSRETLMTHATGIKHKRRVRAALGLNTPQGGANGSGEATPAEGGANGTPASGVSASPAAKRQKTAASSSSSDSSSSSSSSDSDSDSEGAAKPAAKPSPAAKKKQADSSSSSSDSDSDSDSGAKGKAKAKPAAKPAAAKKPAASSSSSDSDSSDSDSDDAAKPAAKPASNGKTAPAVTKPSSSSSSSSDSESEEKPAAKPSPAAKQAAKKAPAPKPSSSSSDSGSSSSSESSDSDSDSGKAKAKGKAAAKQAAKPSGALADEARAGKLYAAVADKLGAVGKMMPKLLGKLVVKHLGVPAADEALLSQVRQQVSAQWQGGGGGCGGVPAWLLLHQHHLRSARMHACMAWRTRGRRATTTCTHGAWCIIRARMHPASMCMSSVVLKSAFLWALRPRGTSLSHDCAKANPPGARTRYACAPRARSGRACAASECGSTTRWSHLPHTQAAVCALHTHTHALTHARTPCHNTHRMLARSGSSPQELCMQPGLVSTGWLK